MAVTDKTPPPPTPPADDRRGFVSKMAAPGIGGIVALGPLVIGAITYFDPFRKKKTPKRFEKEGAGDDGYVLVANLDSLPEDGMPARFVVIADKIDAWNFIPAQPIGSVYLSLQKTDEKTSVLAFNTTCPHAGCSVSYEAQSTAFLCPCHNSSFNTDGTRRTTSKENPSPRDLDQLEVDENRLANGEVWVRFKNYYTGREHMEEKP